MLPTLESNPRDLFKDTTPNTDSGRICLIAVNDILAPPSAHLSWTTIITRDKINIVEYTLIAYTQTRHKGTHTLSLQVIDVKQSFKPEILTHKVNVTLCVSTIFNFDH